MVKMTAAAKSNRKRLWRKSAYHVLAISFSMYNVVWDA